MVPPFLVSDVRSHQIATGAAEAADQPWPSSKEAGPRNETLTSLPEQESRATLNQAAGDRSPLQPAALLSWARGGGELPAFGFEGVGSVELWAWDLLTSL